MKIKILALLLLILGNILAQDATISIPDLTSTVNTDIFVPVNITSLENVGSLTLKIKYDSKVLSFTGNIENNTILGGFFNVNSVGDTAVVVSWYNLFTINLKGKLFDLKFNYIGGNSAVKFDFVEITNNRSVPYNISKIDGRIAGVNNHAPSFVNVLPDTTISHIENLTYLYTGNDQDGDAIVFSLVNGPIGASINNDGLFIWTPVNGEDFAQTIIISLTDQTNTVYDTAKVSIITDIADNGNITNQFVLYQNYPNPFNPSTEIKYSLQKSSNVTIKIYTSIGQEITTLVNKRQKSGQYSVIFNASNLPSGVYFYTILADQYVSAKKMMLLK